MNDDEHAGILVEVLEIFINQILYTREVYPLQIYKKTRAYNTPIYVSAFPPLNTYLYKVLRTAQELQQHRQLKCLEVVMYQGTAAPSIERYAFNLGGGEKTANKPLPRHDEYLLAFEEELRSALYQLAERLKPLRKLPSDTQFKILLHTTQSEFLRLTQNPHQQDFPWLGAQSSDSSAQSCKRQIYLLPLTNVNWVGLDVVAEV